VDVQVVGIEEGLRLALTEDPPSELRLLGNRFAIEKVDSVEVDRLQVQAGGTVWAVGTAVASISQLAEGGALKFADSDIPFGFDVVLDREGRVLGTPAPRFTFDLSSWHGDDDEA
jgi:hypothetical protein